MNWTQETSKRKRRRNEKYEENKSFLRSFYDDSSSLRQQLWIRVENRWSHPLHWISCLLRFPMFWSMLLLVGQFTVNPEIEVEWKEILAPNFPDMFQDDGVYFGVSPTPVRCSRRIRNFLGWWNFVLIYHVLKQEVIEYPAVDWYLYCNTHTLLDAKYE